MQRIERTRGWKQLALVLLAAPTLGGVLSAQAQTAPPGLGERSETMQNVMAGRDLPLSISVQDLDASYRRLVVGGGTDMMSIQMQMIGGQAGVEMGLYFTRGETMSLGSETFLIAYRPQVRIDPEVFRQHGNDGEPARPAKLRPNTQLALSLLNLRTTPSLNDIRPFDRAQDIESPQEGTLASTRNLERLGRGLLTWLNSRGGALPTMGAAVTPALQRTFYPFVHDQRLWTNPSTEQLYRPNPALSRRKPNTITNRKLVWIFAEAAPGGDGTRGVLFLDGHVERVSPERWSRIQRVPIKTRGNDARVVVRPDGTRVTYSKSVTVNVPASNERERQKRLQVLAGACPKPAYATLP